MPFLDRTKEFLSIISIEKNQFSNPLEDISLEKTTKKDKKDAKKRVVSSFQKKISDISDDLIRCQGNLKKLRQLVSTRTPFDDNNSSVQKYTVLIKQQLTQCNYEIQALEEEQSSLKETQTVHQIRHFSQVVSSLQSILMFENKTLMNLLKKRSKRIRSEQKRRKKLITDHRHFDTMDDLLSPVRSHENLLIRQSPEEILSTPTTPSSNTPSSDKGEEEEEIIEQSRRQEIQMIERQDTRTEEVLTIGKDIEQISQMMNKMATMVVKHKELTQRIDDNVTDAHAHVEGGQKQLIKYHDRISTNRGLILKIFAVLILFVVIVGLLVVK